MCYTLKPGSYTVRVDRDQGVYPYNGRSGYIIITIIITRPTCHLAVAAPARSRY